MKSDRSGPKGAVKPVGAVFDNQYRYSDERGGLAGPIAKSPRLVITSQRLGHTLLFLYTRMQHEGIG